MPQKPKKGNWIVPAIVTRKVLLIVENCTKADAEADPMAYCIDEQLIETTDWEIDGEIEPND